MAVADDSDELIAAVTDSTRRQMLDLLLERGESTATSLAETLPVTRQAVSKHLAVLDRAGLVRGHKSGREVRYQVVVSRLDEATHSLAAIASTWDRRLLRIKQIAEAQHRRRSTS
ncbi:MAG TPA: metalloregulator ArsR/SmtB family transcription factor [Gaiellaceae bacterium]|jgi:DNA-binding transcriptional ArsR family regulator